MFCFQNIFLIIYFYSLDTQLIESDKDWELINKEFKKIYDGNKIKFILFDKWESPNSVAIIVDNWKPEWKIIWMQSV